MLGLDLLNRFPGVVRRVTFDKDQLGPRAHGRGSSHGSLDIASLISGRNNDGNALLVGPSIRYWSSHYEERKTKRRQQWSQKTIEQGFKAEQLDREENPGFAPDQLPPSQGQ